MLRFFKWLFLVAVIVAASFAYFFYQQVFASYITVDTELKIPSNSSYNDLLLQLEDKQLIKNPLLFNLLAEKMRLSTNVHSGKYFLKKGTSLYHFIASLRGGWQDPVLLTINNVNFKEDLCSKIGNQLEIDSTSLYLYLNNDSCLAYLGYSKDDILCMFIPNTYEFYWNTSLNAFIEKINNEHTAFWNEQRTAKANALGLDQVEVYVLASIVEKEYKFKEERATIAGVYLNRINLGMKLQADPTVKFALGDLSLKRILTVHTEYKHPYNTYYNLGLPPGPICMPETSTIDAVLNAEEHEYLYFCAREDLSGYHNFNISYDDHLKAARLYQAALNKLQIYE